MIIAFEISLLFMNIRTNAPPARNRKTGFFICKSEAFINHL
jgi:hypothetical protein